MDLFSKKIYWDNRKAGLRGQGTKPKRIIKVYTPEEWDELKKKDNIIIIGDFHGED